MDCCMEAYGADYISTMKSFGDLMGQCYDNFFKSWHEEYEHWVDDEDAIREELHHNQYEGQLYYENGEAHAGPLNKIE